MARRGNLDFLASHSWYVPGFPGTLALLAFLLVGALIAAMIQVALTRWGGVAFAERYATVITYPVMFLPPMIYARTKSLAGRFSLTGIKLDSRHFGQGGAWLCALVAVAATLCLGYCADIFVSLLPAMPEWLEKALQSLTDGNILLNFICVGIFAPLFEEWLCRGMVLRGLLHKRVRPVWAIFISAAVFALIHLNPWQALPAFLFGCLFGFVYFKTGSLKLTMLMHGINNTAALVFGNVEAWKDLQGWHDILSVPAYWTLFAGSLLLVALAVLFFSHIPVQWKEGNCDVIPGESV